MNIWKSIKSRICDCWVAKKLLLLSRNYYKRNYILGHVMFEATLTVAWILKEETAILVKIYLFDIMYWQDVVNRYFFISDGYIMMMKQFSPYS